MLSNMLTRCACLLMLAARAMSFVVPNQQTFTWPSHEKDPNVILEALRQAEIIPDVLDTFSPLISITANWSSTAKTTLGNILPPSLLQHSPDLIVHTIPSAYIPSDAEFVLALTDPDAPSRSDPKWSQVCHWLGSVRKNQPKEIVEYKPPGPPEKTGLHRYVFVVLVAGNGTTEELNLGTPKQRKGWGFKGKRAGLREYARENGLKVIGANFIYAQNDKQ